MLLVASNALGWGREGHRVVSTIAERQLTATARERVQQILGPKVSLAEISTWADEIRPSRPATAPWHYIDIPLNVSAIDAARDCPSGDCVTVAIDRFVGVLRNDASTPEAKEEALKFVVHFVAEIRHLAPETRIVLISSHYTPEEAAMLARLFGDGNFIPKSEAARQLIPAINRLLPDESQAH